MDALLWFLAGCATVLVVRLVLASRTAPKSGPAASSEDFDHTDAPQQPSTPSPEAGPPAAALTRVETASVVEAVHEPSTVTDDVTLESTTENEIEATAPKAPIIIAESRTLADLATSLGAELADLASGVEGQAQLLCETIGQPEQVARRAEQLWEAVRRLRFFTEKMQSFSTLAQLDLEPTNVRMLLGSLSREIEIYSRGSLQVGQDVAPSLPYAMCNPAALRIAALFLIEGLMDMAPDANSLILQAQSAGEEDDSLSVRIDIEAVIDEGSTRAGAIDDGSHLNGLHFSCLAARNLLKSQGADFTLEQAPGLNAIASITLTATDRPVSSEAPRPAAPAPVADPRVSEATTEIPRPAPEAPQPAPARDKHSFGGVLIVEGNATIRDLLARELGKTGRNVVACADGVAARALYEATPERFELLVLERDSRRLRGEELARLAIARDPSLRILMIHPSAGIAPAAELAHHKDLTVLHKPFGLMELRDGLGQAFSSATPG